MQKAIILLILFSAVIFAQQELKIDVTQDMISVDGKKIVKTATVAKQDSLLIKELNDVLQNKREINKNNKAQIQIEPNISYDVFSKIVTTASTAGYTDISYTSKVNGKNYTESINFTGLRPTSKSDEEKYLNLYVGIYKDMGTYKDYLEIGARGGTLPVIFYKECKDGKTIKLCTLRRESEEDPGKIEMSVYSISDSAYLDSNNEFITEPS